MPLPLDGRSGNIAGMRLSPLFAAITAFPLLLGCSSDPDKGDGTGGSGGSGGSGETPPKGDLAATITRYDYTFDMVTGEAASRLDLDVAAPGGDCYAVSCERDVVTDVTWNDAPARSSSIDAGALHACGVGVAGGAPLVLGAKNTVPEATWFGLDVGFSRNKDRAGGQFSYLLSWVGGCDRFGPCDDAPSRIADFHFTVKHPEGAVVLCPGTLTPGATQTECEVKGAPTYSAFGIAADPLWQKNALGTFAGIDVVFYEVPGGDIAKALEPAKVQAYLEWITGLLGPFPYGKELRLAGAPTAWLGFEHPANIILNEHLPNASGVSTDPTMHVLMHEIAHQWAGDRTTLATAVDFVWKEATAEYLAYVFEDEKGTPQQAAATRTYWDAASLQVQYWPRPQDEPAPSVDQFYGDVYGPGPMVLYLQLEALIGRPSVLKGIQSFLAQPGARSVDDLRKALEAASGKDLAAYFNAWVFGKGKPAWPTFDVKASQAAGTATVTVTQQNAAGKVFPCAVEVNIEGATKSARVVVDFGTAPANATATATVPFEEAVTSTVLDPDHRLINFQSGVQPLVKPVKVYIF
jgi:aminopeptidase N